MLFQLPWPWIKEPACCSFTKKSERICTICECLKVVFIPLKRTAVQNRILCSRSRGQLLTHAEGNPALPPPRWQASQEDWLCPELWEQKQSNLGWKKQVQSTMLRIRDSCMSPQKGDVCHRGWEAQLLVLGLANSLAPLALLPTAWANETSKRQHEGHADFSRGYFGNCQNQQRVASPPRF